MKFLELLQDVQLIYSLIVKLSPIVISFAAAVKAVIESTFAEAGKPVPGFVALASAVLAHLFDVLHLKVKEEETK